MKLTVEQSGELTEIEIVIRHNDKLNAVKRLTHYIEQFNFQLKGKKEGKTYYIPVNEIYYFESIDEKIFIYSLQEVFETTYRLYELEQLLEQTNFQRISKSTLLNIEKMDSVRPLFNGKLEASLKNEEKLIINRHYVKQLKEKIKSFEVSS
ncbi:LytTR family DNA-binding domain-containing protein [Enterococcus ureasiticus]|uniref:HTH LytTR-type domain-containing protein n=1 Tax=Enterococcus ureasiticus TaxID=903984 RepID=A0A1E5GNI4_9ENTE|nr:LytTR family DNA-binding domain-containing protein [Enterococcus ureasiticus]OEG14264.1 hypothetical protein BCR21_04540 [Enterococcus ureasiticus]